MKKHYVGRFDETKFATPALYAGHSDGYARVELVDHSINPAAVHMGLGVAQLEPGGWLNPHLHAYEKGFYVLKGGVIGEIDGRAYHFSADDYGLIPMGVTHSWRNVGNEPARILEMMAPQPKPPGHPFRDTYFHTAGSPPRQAAPPDFGDPRVSKTLGHFDEAQLPDPGEIQAVGARGGSIHGISLKEFIDRMLGAQHMAMFMVQFRPGGMGTYHDHMLEESYFLVAGEAQATLDGAVYHIKAGDYVWTGVGCFHSFENIGSTPVRWIETQAPLPTPAEAFRFKADWDYLRERVEGS